MVFCLQQPLTRFIHIKFSIFILAFLLTFLSAQPSAHAKDADSSFRIAAVNIADDILKSLIDQFQKSGSTRIKIVYTGNDPFSVAKAGKADMVIAHYGQQMVQGFIEAGYGLFPGLCLPIRLSLSARQATSPG